MDKFLDLIIGAALLTFLYWFGGGDVIAVLQKIAVVVATFINVTFQM